MARYCATILLGAFLLFQVQPQIARTILPWFGGGAAVWSTCMLFFQVLLLGGYAYAHFLNRRLPPGKQAVLHVILLSISFYFLPVTPAAHWQPTGTENPSLHILLLLTATVGMPYLLLSATGPLLQAWFAREFKGRSPYRLYALSNVGSLAALLSFPFLFEPNLSIGIQAHAWSFAYLGFAGLCGICAYTTARAYSISLVSPRESSQRPAPLEPFTRAPADPSSHDVTPPDVTPQDVTPQDITPHEAAAPAVAVPAVAAHDVPPEDPVIPVHTEPAPSFASGSGGVALATPTAQDTTTRVSAPPLFSTPEPVPAPTAADKLGWIALAALPSVMLLAVTNAICQDIAVMPFFWVMPLSLYLVTFILTFESDRWYRRPLFAPLLAATALALFLTPQSWFIESLTPQVLLLCGGLFFCGMLCHGELVKNRPATDHLTAFYLFVSLGGALGGVFVALVAPALFTSYLEVEIALGGCLIAAIYAGFKFGGRGGIRILFRVGLPIAFSVAFVVGVFLRIDGRPDYVWRSRNFFGALNVQSAIRVTREGASVNKQTTLALTHGSTIHGQQAFGTGIKTGQAMTYFWPGSGVAHALVNHPAAARGPLQVGIIGLGTGTLAYYARKGDRYSYFEIDPDIERVAEKHFTYMRDARARGATIDVTIGDARIQLERDFERNGSRKFDVLVVDAFSSDAIPIHLLTKECNEVYWRHLTEDGILMIHISNRHLDLTPATRGLARAADKQLRRILARPENIPGANASNWIIITNNAEYLAREELQVSPETASDEKPSLLWTDDFSSLWHVLK